MNTNDLRLFFKENNIGCGEGMQLMLALIAEETVAHENQNINQINEALKDMFDHIKELATQSIYH